MLTFGHRQRGAALPAPTSMWAGVATCALPEADPGGPRRPPLRLPYHLLLLTTAGHDTVEVDFAAQPCRPGTLLWIRAGQAVRFGAQPDHDAALVAWARHLIAADDAAGAPVDAEYGPLRWQLTGEDEDAVITEFSQLEVDYRRHSAGDIAAALLRHELTVLLLRLVLLTGPDDGAGRTAERRTFARFRQELENRHAASRRVEDYARHLGCSVRTLTRASLAVAGRTAKQVVDDRVALEARRLLACTDEPIADIGRGLGFPEPTNFGRFFHRETGLSPGAFRAAAGGEMAVPAQRRPTD
jgi:AraC-like DNA-binding protein